MIARLLLLTMSLLVSACAMTPEQQEALDQSLAAFAQGAQAASAPVAPKLMIFGGDGHKTYLGCLNCNQYASDSVLNTYGSYGSAYSTSSLANSYGDFGSPYSTYSACNPYATDPPVVVDNAGNFYGRLTVNAYNSERIHDQTVLAWLAATCAH